MTMAAFVLGCRLLLAVVFGVAGLAKLVDLAGSRRSLVDFGVPRRLAAPLGLSLPIAELIAAGALLFRPTAVWGAAGALALVLCFIAGIATSLARGRTPNCHCFGQLHSAPVGWKVLARNIVLGAIAVFAIVGGWSDPGPGVFAWLVPLTVFERTVVLGGAVGLVLLSGQIALLTRLVRQTPRVAHPADAPNADTPSEPAAAESSRLALPAASLPVGSAAPAFSLAGLDGGLIGLETLCARHTPILLVFADPGCGPCGALLPKVAAWQREHAGTVTVVLVSRGTLEANRGKADEHGLTLVLLQRDREVATAYGVLGTPSAVLVDADGKIGSPPAQGQSAIVRLLEGEVGRLSAAATVSPADRHRKQEPPGRVPEDRPAPDFALTNLDGDVVNLSQFIGPPTVLVFWNPGCGFCRRMLDDLKGWDARPPAERGQLLVVSSGSPDDNRALGLTSTIVLDATFSVGQHYGARGTPAAALIGPDGSLDGAIATGAPDVLALLAAAMSAALPAESTPVKHEDVADELLPDGGMMLFNAAREQVLTLNGTAALIWECCDGGHSIASIIAEVRDVFPTAADAERDGRQLLDTLLRRGMIRLAAPGARAHAASSSGTTTAAGTA